MEEKAKVCTICNELKSIDDFPNYSVKGYTYKRSFCKVCDNKRRDDRRKRNGESVGRVKNHKVRARKHTLKQYGLTTEDYSELIYLQRNKCAICGESANGKTLHVDHNHETGKVRGLLCFHCNLLLGHAKEDKEILLSAIAYLNRDV